MGNMIEPFVKFVSLLDESAMQDEENAQEIFSSVAVVVIKADRTPKEYLTTIKEEIIDCFVDDGNGAENKKDEVQEQEEGEAEDEE
jgi:hypothetical protein